MSNFTGNVAGPETSITLASSTEMAVDPAVLVREGILAASIVILFLLVGLVLLIGRTKSLPVCRNCGFKSVRRAHSHQSAVDSFARACFLYPYRCEKCLRRFYCFGAHRRPGHSGSMSMAAGKN
jgi:hypothetical protein